LVGHRLSFLLVDGDDESRRKLARDLAGHGEITVADTFAAASSSLRTTKFDALVFNVSLPDGNGFGLADLAHTRSPSTWSLAVSDNPEHEVITVALEKRVHFCLKPITQRHLDVLLTEAQARHLALERRLEATLERWRSLSRLTAAELELLRHAADGQSREEMAFKRKVTVETIRKQAQAILRKTRARSFDAAVVRLLREAAAEQIT